MRWWFITIAISLVFIYRCHREYIKNMLAKDELTGEDIAIILFSTAIFLIPLLNVIISGAVYLNDCLDEERFKNPFAKYFRKEMK